MTAAVIDRETFLAERRKGIGGSDVAALLGLDKKKTPYQLWREKTGHNDEGAKGAALRRGNFLEDAVLARYESEMRPTTFDIQVPHAADGGWRRGNQDARAVMPDQLRRCVEVKTVNSNVFRNDWGNPWTDEVPDRALCQGLWYASLDNADIVDFAVMVVPEDPDEVLGLNADEVVAISNFHIFQAERKPKLEAAIVERARQFWFDHVEANIAPEPTSEGDVDLLWPYHINGEVKEADEQVMALLAAYDDVCSNHRDADKERKKLRERILLAAGGCEAFVKNGSPLLTLKTQDRKASTTAASTSRPLRFTKWWERIQPKKD